MDKVDFYEICANTDILATQSLFVMEFSPYILKIAYITINYELFSNLNSIRKNLPPNLNKGFIEPHCILGSKAHNAACEHTLNISPQLLDLGKVDKSLIESTPMAICLIIPTSYSAYNYKDCIATYTAYFIQHIVHRVSLNYDHI